MINNATHILDTYSSCIDPILIFLSNLVEDQHVHLFLIQIVNITLFLQNLIKKFTIHHPTIDKFDINRMWY